MKRRSSRWVLVIPLACVASLGASCTSDEPAITGTTEKDVTMNDDVANEIERPTGVSRQIVATEMIPSRSQGITMLVYDAVGGDQTSFSAESGAGDDLVVAEWSGLPAGALVEWGGGVIEVTEIQGETTVVFTVWEP